MGQSTSQTIVFLVLVMMGSTAAVVDNKFYSFMIVGLMFLIGTFTIIWEIDKKRKKEDGHNH